MQHLGTLWMQLGTPKWRNQICIHHRNISHTGDFTFPSNFNDIVKQNCKTKFWRTQENKKLAKRKKKIKQTRTLKISKKSCQKSSINMSFCFFSTAVHAAGWIIYINLKSAKRKVWNSIGIRCPEDTCGCFWFVFYFFLNKTFSSPLCNIMVLIGVVFISLHIVSVNERFNSLL